MRMGTMCAKDTVASPDGGSHADGGHLLSDDQMTRTSDLIERDRRPDLLFCSANRDHSLKEMKELRRLAARDLNRILVSLWICEIAERGAISMVLHG
jgi:hypothetical protein